MTPDDSDSHEPLARAVPTARVTPRRRPSLLWLVPLAALAAAVWTILAARDERGPLLVIRAAEGHGIEPGDPLRFRGIDAGSVVSVDLEEDLSGVVLRVRLEADAQSLARAGTRFFVVRPELSFEGVAGLETLLGPRYVEALPSAEPGARQLEFVALEAPPSEEDVDPAGLEVVLLAASTHGLVAGSPLRYRDIPVGSVLSVGLATDAADVELSVYVRPAYRQLVRDDSRFFVESGVELAVGLTGFELGLGSLRSLLVPSIGLATPDEPGELASTGERFELAPEPKPAWLGWRPAIAVGNELLPAGTPALRPARATLTWTSEKLFIERDHRRTAWVTPLGDALLGPAELLAPEERARGAGFELEVGGTRLAISDDTRSVAGAALMPGVGRIGIPWPADRVRRPTAPEDCLVIGDPARPPVALHGARLTLEADGLALDAAYSLGEAWQGAPVVSRADGALLGLLLVLDDGARVAFVP